MSSLVQKLIGSYAAPLPSAHALAEIVERELKEGRYRSKVESFLKGLPESPQLHTVHAVSIHEDRVSCSAVGKVKDHENPRFFEASVQFEVDLKTGECELRPSQQGVV